MAQQSLKSREYQALSKRERLLHIELETIDKALEPEGALLSIELIHAAPQPQGAPVAQVVQVAPVNQVVAVPIIPEVAAPVLVNLEEKKGPDALPVLAASKASRPPAPACLNEEARKEWNNLFAPRPRLSQEAVALPLPAPQPLLVQPCIPNPPAPLVLTKFDFAYAPKLPPETTLPPSLFREPEDVPEYKDNDWMMHGPARVYRPLVENVAVTLFGPIQRGEVSDLVRVATTMCDAVATTWAKPEKEGGKNIKCFPTPMSLPESAAAAIEHSHATLRRARDAVQSTTDFVVDTMKFGVTAATARERTGAYLSKYAIHNSLWKRIKAVILHGKCLPVYEIPSTSHALSPLWAARQASCAQAVGASLTGDQFYRMVESIQNHQRLATTTTPFQ